MPSRHKIKAKESCALRPGGCHISAGPGTKSVQLISYHHRVMPAALVPRSWDFSDPPGSPPRAVAVMDNGADGPKVGMQIPMGPGEVSDPPTLTITPATLPRGGGAGGVAITA